MIESAEIRLIRVDEADAYVALRAEMIVREPYAYLGVPGDDFSSSAEKVRAMLEDPEQAIFGGFSSGALVASAGIYREKRVKRRHRAGIWGVYTSPDARGAGLGRRLVSACIDRARDWAGVRIVGLCACVRSRAAIGLYESLGFVTWGVEPGSTVVDGELLDEVHMSIELRGERK